MTVIISFFPPENKGCNNRRVLRYCLRYCLRYHRCYCHLPSHLVPQLVEESKKRLSQVVANSLRTVLASFADQPSRHETSSYTNILLRLQRSSRCHKRFKPLLQPLAIIDHHCVLTCHVCVPVPVMLRHRGSLIDHHNVLTVALPHRCFSAPRLHGSPAPLLLLPCSPAPLLPCSPASLLPCSR